MANGKENLMNKTIASASKEQQAWRELVLQWETNTELNNYLATFYRHDIYIEPLTGLVPEIKLILLTTNAIISTVYMNAYSWDHVTTRNYAVVAELLSRSIGSREGWLIEQRKSLKDFPKEFREIYTTDYQNGHYRIDLNRAKKIMAYLSGPQFKQDMNSLLELERAKLWK